MEFIGISSTVYYRDDFIGVSSTVDYNEYPKESKNGHYQNRSKKKDEPVDPTKEKS